LMPIPFKLPVSLMPTLIDYDWSDSMLWPRYRNRLK
jgi:hypothetical protein